MTWETQHGQGSSFLSPKQVFQSSVLEILKIREEADKIIILGNKKASPESHAFEVAGQLWN